MNDDRRVIRELRLELEARKDCHSALPDPKCGCSNCMAHALAGAEASRDDLIAQVRKLEAERDDLRAKLRVVETGSIRARSSTSAASISAALSEACGACGSTTGAAFYERGPLAGLRRCWPCAKPALTEVHDG